MPKLPAAPAIDWTRARRHIARADPIMARLMKRVGPCTLASRGGYFPALCQSIFSQQISGVVARAIFARFKAHFPRGRISPRLTLALTDAQLQSCGLSRQKCLYIRDLADKFHSGSIPTRRLQSMGDEEIIEALTCVKGIGRWTAEMFLIFVLNRPDVMPVDDLGIKKSFERFYRLRSLPKPQKMLDLSDSWRPWRTLGTWYLWRGLALPKGEDTKT